VLAVAIEDPSRREPIERRETVRQSILHALEQEELTAADIAQRLGLREREVVGHLEHLVRSLLHVGQCLTVAPAECRSCGFVFRKRERLGRPSACPQCRSERIEPPRFRVVPG
jgi:predicted Zn-ribbon and HTH transcriptional regulator